MTLVNLNCVSFINTTKTLRRIHRQIATAALAYVLPAGLEEVHLTDILVDTGVSKCEPSRIICTVLRTPPVFTSSTWGRNLAQDSKTCSQRQLASNHGANRNKTPELVSTVPITDAYLHQRLHHRCVINLHHGLCTCTVLYKLSRTYLFITPA
jgi:hypothetical protein